MADILEDSIRALIGCAFIVPALLYGLIFASSFREAAVPMWLIWTVTIGPSGLAALGVLTKAARAYARRRASRRGGWRLVMTVAQ